MFSNLLAARVQMGTSLIFHIVFSVLGVVLPLMLCIAEGLALWKKDGSWMALSRQWTKAFAILFAIGAVSGAIVEFEISLLWPTFTQYSGAIIGLPFALEGFAFFIEGIFLGVYLYGARRLSPRVHWLSSFPIWISGVTSAWFITSANSWMNSPAGFQIVHGQVTGIDPFEAMLNPSTPYETTHMILACYVATGFGIAAVYAVGMLRGKRDDYHRNGLLLAMAMGVIAIPLQIVSGDANARFLVEAQPAKLAAMEGVFKTERGAPLMIGGLADPGSGKVIYALEIPRGLSILATFDPNSTIKGLNTYAPDDRPNPLPVHTSFDGMVASGFFAFFVALIVWFLYFLKQRTVPTNRVMLWAVVLAGPLSFLAIELGWMVTELGRQPWVIYGYLRTQDAVTTAPWLNISFLIFTLIYVLLAVALISLLLRVARSPLPEVEIPGNVQKPERAGV